MKKVDKIGKKLEEGLVKEMKVVSLSCKRRNAEEEREGEKVKRKNQK